MCFTTSNWAALCLGMIWSAIFFSSELNFLNRSSNSSDRSWKAKIKRSSSARKPLTDSRLQTRCRENIQRWSCHSFFTQSDSHVFSNSTPDSVSNQCGAAFSVTFNTRCAGSLISLTWPLSHVPVRLHEAYRR